MQNNSIKSVVATGIGSALFIIIGIFVNIPIFGNTSIQLQYAVLALFSTLFGPVAGFLIGFIGHALKDSIQYGSLSWAWILGSGIVGMGIGLLRQKYDISKGIFKLPNIIWFNLAQTVSVFVGYALIAPIGDKIQFAQSWSYLFVQGFVASVSNALTIGVGGTILLAIYAKTQTQAGSLSKE
ncbi:ECF-type riboflavin transporter substrate-binding protein [Streptococcus macacae]|uniref:UPF0397 protein STRMA_1380 n=1 Tax=Streptococcus macacae NCTC 11558 TaxID=764298 RepID=G5JUZ5_9STRE|nr:ECF-type riboflavin transporter substrate-binding protein [Streptococcus macacae]EHJ52803.1 hypothetical protein STRMA_1380 [Streptococcus macacae NCTC 11558]SUN79292.1 membrane protein [Streptococcus macacae NCTC 11558]